MILLESLLTAVSNRFLMHESASITLSILHIVKHRLHVWPGTLFIKLSAAGVHAVHSSEVLAAHPSSPDPFKHLRILTTVVTSFFLETITCRNISTYSNRASVVLLHIDIVVTLASCGWDVF